MLIRDILKYSGIDPDSVNNIDITGIYSDSRKVSANSIFCVVEGNSQNGNKFIGEAVKKGAKVILTEKKIDFPENGVFVITSKNIRKDMAILAKNFFHNCADEMDIYAVTGTNGKTSSVMAINSILKYCGISSGYITTIEKGWDNIIKPSNLTTPDPFELHSVFFEMYQAGCKCVSLEASSHGIHQLRLYGIPFKCRILTNITSDHLDYHKTIEEYRRVKISFLSEGKDVSIINLNDEYGREVILNKKNIFTYALGNKNADLNCEIIKKDENIFAADLIYKDKKIRVNKPHISFSFMLENILAAVSAAVISNIKWDNIIKGVENFVPPRGRMSKIECSKGFNVFIDYAHTPDALEKSLLALKPLVKNKLRVVFGCGGNRDKTKRPLMGEIADRISDYIYLTSDNSRLESSSDIMNEIKRGIKNNKKLFCFEDRFNAIQAAIFNALEGDVILIAGKGHEEYQDINGIKTHFSDFEAARDIINQKG